MDFGFSSSQRTWHDAALAFAERELQEDDLRGRDLRQEFWREGWNRCARFGIQALPIPEEFGGRGLGLSETIAAMEGLGYGCRDNGLLFAINACLWTVTLPLITFGTDEQQRRYLPKLGAEGLVGANAASESGAGSDIFAMTTSAEPSRGGWVLNGRKTWITAGPVADMFVAYATIDRARGPLGITAFLVEKDAPGFSVAREIPKMGMRTAPMAEMRFENCWVGEDAVLGKVGRGVEVFRASMNWERGAILAAALGTMRRQLDRCCAFARERRQFDQPIGKFQAVSHRIAEMAVRLETCRPLVYKVGWLVDRGEDASFAAAAAKLHVSECFVQNSLDAVRTFGALGYVVEGEIERDLRDSVGSLIFSGTNDVQKAIIARELRL